MADTQRPLDITWDDVRGSRPSRRRQWLVGAGALLISVGCALVFGMRTVAAPVPPVLPGAEAEVRQPLVLKRMPSQERGSFCGMLFRWSSNTVLTIGPETRSYCGKRFPSI